MIGYLRHVLASSLLLVASSTPLEAADLAFSVARWPCGTSPQKAPLVEWSDAGVLSVDVATTEPSGSVIEDAGAAVEEKDGTLFLTYTERTGSPAGPATACATPVVLRFRVSGLQRKPGNIRLMARRLVREIAAGG